VDDQPPRFGVGPAISAVVLVWAGAMGAVHVIWYPTFAVTGPLRIGFAVAGIVLGIVGVVLYGWGLRVFNRARRADRLATTGPYARCRHPIYGTWIFLVGPGICLLTGSWLLLTTSVVAYVAARLLVGREERTMAARYGEAWRAYRARTGRFVPRWV